MDGKWQIIYYETRSGQSPVFDFIQSFEMKTRSKISNTLDLLKEYGICLGQPHSKKLTGTDLWELRILGTDNLRIFYVAIIQKSFLLLHGINKKKQKTDIKDVRIAPKTSSRLYT